MCAAIQLELFSEAFKDSNLWPSVGIDVSTRNVKDLKSNSATNALKVMMLPTREDPPKVESILAGTVSLMRLSHSFLLMQIMAGDHTTSDDDRQVVINVCVNGEKYKRIGSDCLLPGWLCRLSRQTRQP